MATYYDFYEQKCKKVYITSLRQLLPLNDNVINKTKTVKDILNKNAVATDTLIIALMLQL